MINYVVGNLITAAQDGSVDVIAHQANCFNAMGAGIAPQIAAAFPDAEKADNETLAGDKDKLGTYTLGQHDLDNGNILTIFNLYGQYTASRGSLDTDYEALRAAMESMRCLLLPFDRIGFPKIGCGLAGGDWNIVSEMIDDVFDAYEVYVYVLDAGEIPDNI